MYSPPTKRVKYDSPTQSTSYLIPSLQVYEPDYYTQPGTAPTTFQQPSHLTSFSYSPIRETLIEKTKRNESMSYYREPKIGSDLNFGFNDATWREDTIDEGLDSLLDTLDNFALEDPTGAASDVLSKTNVITWRGMITKLLLAVYEVEGAGRGRSEGWEMNAMVVDGVLYLEEVKTPASMISKSNNEKSFKAQSYMGYSFEAYSTTPSTDSTSDFNRQSPPSFSIPNTNVQWCSIVKTNLGGFRILVGGEVDCLLPGSFEREEAITSGSSSINTSDFVELKTNIVIERQRDEINFERLKLLKHYIQSFLLGVPLIIVGFRTRSGELTAIQSFKTLEIPRLVRGKPHAWNPLACLASGRAILGYLHSEIFNHPSTKQFQTTFNSPTSSVSTSELESWPVFRIKFDPKSGEGSLGPGLNVRELSKEEIDSEVIAGKKLEKRVGFLLARWVEGARRRKEQR